MTSDRLASIMSVDCGRGKGWWVWPETRQVLRGWGAHGPSVLSIPATPTAPPCGPVETGSGTTDGGFMGAGA